MLQTVLKLSLELLELTVSAPVIWFLCEKALLPSLSQQNSFHTAPAKVRVAGYGRDWFHSVKSRCSLATSSPNQDTNHFPLLAPGHRNTKGNSGHFRWHLGVSLSFSEDFGGSKVSTPLVTTCISIIANIVSRTLWSLSKTSSTSPGTVFWHIHLGRTRLVRDFGQDNGRQRTCPGEAMKLFTKSYEQKWFPLVSLGLFLDVSVPFLTLNFLPWHSMGHSTWLQFQEAKLRSLLAKIEFAGKQDHISHHIQVLSIP